jgi:hypothetical protein
MTKNRYRLYWVETPSSEENCFVAARSKRAAEKYEEDGTGFDPGDCRATLLRNIDDDWVAEYRGNEELIGDFTAPFYVRPEDVHQLGITWRIVDGDDTFEYGDHHLVKQGDLNYLASLGEPPKLPLFAPLQTCWA